MTLDPKAIRKKFQVLFDHSLDLIYVHDLKGNFIDANDRCLATLGFNRENMQQISFKDLIEKNQMIKAFRAIKEIIEYRKQITPNEYKIKTRDGLYRYFVTYGVPIKEDQKIIGILGIAKDITQKKSLVDALEESKSELKKLNKQLERQVEAKNWEVKKSEEKIQRIYEAVPDVFFLVSGDSTIIDFKGKEEDLYVPPEELKGKKIVDMLPPAIAELSIKSIKKTIETKNPIIIEYSLLINEENRKFEARHLFYDIDTVAIFIREIKS